MAEMGLDIRGHSARGIDTVDVSAFDLVVAMDPGIAYSLRSRGTDPATIIELVIPDPYGNGIECYRAAVDSIVLELRRIFPGKSSRSSPTEGAQEPMGEILG
jgi:protein-tyrosine-phosphatase